MSKIKIVYASITGNNEEIADIIEEGFEDIAPDSEIDLEELSQADPTDLTNYDILVVVTYTYDGEIVPDEAFDYYEEIQELDLANLIYGVAGSGDHFYEHFCSAVDNFEIALSQTGAVKGAEAVKIDLSADSDDIANLDEFAQKLIDVAEQEEQ